MTRTSLCITVFVLGLTVPALGQNTVTFYNQSGEPALVKLVGPTDCQVQVPNGAQQTVAANAGTYFIKVRYGMPDDYSYAKGENFEVTETDTHYSATTLTLHKVTDGNYDSHPIPESEF